MKIEKATKILSDNHIKHGGTVRCGICGNVSNENIETNIGDFRPGMSFTQDPKDKNQFICVDCSEVINDLRFDYELMDQED